MKKRMVDMTRSVLPTSMLGRVESAYRISRARLISARYGHPARRLRVIGVTGTNGKTTTVNYLNEIFKEAGYKTAMFSTAVIEIAGNRRANDLNATVPTVGEIQRFFLEAKRAKVDFVVMEFPSHALDQHKLDGVPVEAAIMTNLTQDHLDYHGTMELYAAAKAKLFKLEPKYIILNRDDEWFEYFNQFPARSQKIHYGWHEDAEARITHTKLYKKGTEATLLIDHQTKLELATALPGEFNVANMAAAVSCAYLLGVNKDDIVEGVANLEEIPGRFERVDNDRDIDIIVDYAHTPDGLEKLLQAARAITKGRVILVFGSCGDRDKGKRPIMGEIAVQHADRIFVTDEESYNEEPDGIRKMILEGVTQAGGDGKTTEIADRREAIAKALSIARKGDTVLVTGLGHEVYRIINGERVPWNDTSVITELLDERPKSKKS